MGVDVLPRSPVTASSAKRLTAKPVRKRKRIGVNALIALGLWTLLWGGYNTGPWYWSDPHFPANTMALIHGLRAFSPMLAGWIALLILLSRPERVLEWMMGPMGLLVLFSVIGLASSITLSAQPAEAAYWGANYLSIVLVLLAVLCLGSNLRDLSQLLAFNWMVAIIITIGLLVALRYMGGLGPEGAGSDPYSVLAVRRLYNGHADILDMASARNTGFGRYAAIAALAALARLHGGKLVTRILWVAAFLVSLYALVLANGRTEVTGFILGAFIVLYADKRKRVAYFVAALGVAVLLGLKGFYSEFFQYFTRTGRLDRTVMTMSGRTVIWHKGIHLLSNSPWVGWGFQADRIYLEGWHLHNAFLAAFLQSGIVGGTALILAIGLIGFFIVKYFFVRRPASQELIPAEIPGIFLFLLVSSVAESTFAYFSAAWLLCAPIFAYSLVLHREIQRSSLAAERERNRRATFRPQELRGRRSPETGPAVPVAGRSPL